MFGYTKLKAFADDKINVTKKLKEGKKSGLCGRVKYLANQSF